MTQPKFNQKHYKVIAIVLRPFRDPGDEGLWQNLVEAFSTMFAKDNPAFDAKEFYKACRHARPQKLEKP